MFGVNQSHSPSPFGPVRPLGSPQSIGGVPGVSVVPTSSVQPPAALGGPHALPNLPQFPLPEGFPNPFALQQLTLPAQAHTLPTGPGITYTTGPNNPVPGAVAGHAFPGYPQVAQFPPSTAGHPGFPAAQSYGPSNVPQWLTPQTPAAQWPTAPPSPVSEWPTQPQVTMPLWPGSSQAPAQAPPAAESNSFWMNLGWQLLLTPAGRQALGERYSALMEGPDRQRTLALAAQCLVKESLQTAYKDLTAGTMTQNKFIDLFSAELAEAVKAIEI